MLIFPAIALNHMLLIIIWYFFHNYFWPRPRPYSPGLSLVALTSASVSTSKLWSRPQPRSSGLGLGFGLEVLASFNITGSHLVQYRFKIRESSPEGIRKTMEERICERAGADLTGGHLCSGRLGPRPVMSWGPLE